MINNENPLKTLTSALVPAAIMGVGTWIIRKLQSDSGEKGNEQNTSSTSCQANGSNEGTPLESSRNVQVHDCGANDQVQHLETEN